MHPYVIDSNERVRIVLWISMIAVLLAWGIGQSQEKFNFIIPWWFDAPSVLGFFGLLYKLVDCYLWKIPILQKIGFFKTPDLNGKWITYINSSHDDYSQNISANVTIKQTWTRIVICLNGSQSSSTSRIASILVENSGQTLLSYEYMNQPNSNAPNTMHIHFGFTRLILSDDKRILSGDYYNGRGRANCGTLRLEKEN